MQKYKIDILMNESLGVMSTTKEHIIYRLYNTLHKDGPRHIYWKYIL